MPYLAMTSTKGRGRGGGALVEEVWGGGGEGFWGSLIRKRFSGLEGKTA